MVRCLVDSSELGRAPRHQRPETLPQLETDETRRFTVRGLTAAARSGPGGGAGTLCGIERSRGRAGSCFFIVDLPSYKGDSKAGRLSGLPPLVMRGNHHYDEFHIKVGDDKNTTYTFVFLVFLSQGVL